jgi:hypothetical protein
MTEPAAGAVAAPGGAEEAGILARVLAQVDGIHGIEAIVLGGSRATGSSTPASDIDIGLYYRRSNPPDIDALRSAAQRLDDRHRADLVTDLGGWGPWIDGGGWLTIEGLHVDLLYRDLDRVEQIRREVEASRLEVVYQPGHPFGFVSSIYLAEAATCRPLRDPAGTVAALKATLTPYPATLGQGTVERFGWEIGFALENAAKAAARGDVAYVSGCAFRAVMCMAAVLHAINGEWWLNEKGALARTERFAVRPTVFRGRAETAIARLSADPSDLRTALDALRALCAETLDLAGWGNVSLR